MAVEIHGEDSFRILNVTASTQGRSIRGIFGNRWCRNGGVLTILPPGAYPSPFKQGPSYLPHLSPFLFFPVILAPHVSVASHGFLLRRGGQQTLPLSRAPGAVPGLTSQLLQIRHAVYSVPAPAIGSKHCGWAKQEDRFVRP